MTNKIRPVGDDLEKLVKDEEEHVSVESSTSESSSVGIAFFDLSKSTEMKITEGHQVGIDNILLHNRLCTRITNRFNGVDVKGIGDGILVTFDDPMDACLAGMNIMVAIRNYTDFSTKGSITYGKIENVSSDGRNDVLGSAVDRCAKLLQLAEPYDLILDTPLYEMINSHISDYPTLTISDRGTAQLDGFDRLDIYNLDFETVESEMAVHGRRKIDEKRDFISSATDEVIEMGIGITTFSDYFVSRSNVEFKEAVIKLLERGVDFKCIMLDPESVLV